jgi:long-chain fatty acid transport protein
VAAFSVFSRLNPRWAVMADVTWTNWSRFEELRVEYDNLLPDTVVQQNWDDAFRYCVGVTYTMNDAWKFRTGFAYDESPVPDAFRTPRIPDEDRTWLSFGVAHRISPVGTIDVGYLHVFVDDSAINKVGESDRSPLIGSYQSTVDVLSLQYTHQF